MHWGLWNGLLLGRPGMQDLWRQLPWMWRQKQSMHYVQTRSLLTGRAFACPVLSSLARLVSLSIVKKCIVTLISFIQAVIVWFPFSFSQKSSPLLFVISNIWLCTLIILLCSLIIRTSVRVYQWYSWKVSNLSLKITPTSLFHSNTQITFAFLSYLRSTFLDKFSHCVLQTQSQT